MINNVNYTQTGHLQKQSLQTQETKSPCQNNCKVSEVSFSGNPSVYQGPPNIYLPFQIPTNLMKERLIPALDGLIPGRYQVLSVSQNFPQRTITQDIPGFNKELGLNAEQTFLKGPRNGGIDYFEKEVAANQAAYDANVFYPPGTAEYNAVLNVRNFLSALFQGPVYNQLQGILRPEFDTNNNGTFDPVDVDALASADSDSSSISSRDLDIITRAYIQNKPPFRP
jgi:hypothetical protein